jgi:hypothetical protein
MHQWSSTRAGITVGISSLALALTLAAARPAGAAQAGAASLSASARPAWHVDYRVPGTNILGLSAAGQREAWAIGTGPNGGLLLRWDGARWRSVLYPDHRHYLPTAIYALSATDMWLFGSDSAQSEESILHWTNGTWQTMSLPVNAQNVQVLADNDIWLAGGDLPGCYDRSLDSQGCTVTAHWNGSKWHFYPLRAVGVESFAGSSPANVWAVGESYLRQKPCCGGGSTQTFRPLVFRWTGSHWRSTSLRLPRAPWALSIVARSSRDAYVAAATHADRRACAMHWTGRRWSPFYLPGQPGPCVWTISDYRRGLWLVGPPAHLFTWVHWTGKRFTHTPGFVPNHSGYNTDGLTLAAVPHSTSAWLFGSYCNLTLPCRTKGLIAELRTSGRAAADQPERSGDDQH